MNENRIKYPRTLHLPYSPTVHSDDKALKDTSQFEGEEVVVTIKMDGENTTLAPTYSHARSVDSKNHPSRNWLKNFHSVIKMDIPEGWRVCGENLYAQHSIAYNHLKTFFYAFSIWDENNHCLSWEDTLEWCNLIGLEPVHVIYKGVFNADLIQEAYHKYERESDDGVEGYVVRLASGFHYSKFGKSVAKWVRPNHVQTDKHWSHCEVKPNSLDEGISIA